MKTKKRLVTLLILTVLSIAMVTPNVASAVSSGWKFKGNWPGSDRTMWIKSTIYWYGGKNIGFSDIKMIVTAKTTRKWPYYHIKANVNRIGVKAVLKYRWWYRGRYERWSIQPDGSTGWKFRNEASIVSRSNIYSAASTYNWKVRAIGSYKIASTLYVRRHYSPILY